MDNSSLERELLAATGGGRGGSPPRQLVVKLLKPVKSRTSTVAMVRYVARLHAGDVSRPVAVYNEAGEEVLDAVMPRKVGLHRLDAELGFWPLLADADNLSPHATALLEAQGAAALEKLAERDRFRNRQAYHLIVSLASEEEPGDAEKLLAAVQEAVIELFGETGHSALLALHQDTEHPHVHVVVSAGPGGTVKPSAGWGESLLAALSRHLEGLRDPVPTPCVHLTGRAGVSVLRSRLLRVGPVIRIRFR